MTGTSKLPLWAEVDLGAVKRNVGSLKGLLTGDAEFLAVVKANGYGHGDAEVAKAAVAGGADRLGVARVSEGASLRKAGIDRPILLLAEPPVEAVDDAVALDLTPTLYTKDLAARFSRSASSSGVERSVHIKVDTGMHRYGLHLAEALDFLDFVDGLEGLHVEGIWTHFAVAEDVLNPFTKQQFERFSNLLEALGGRTGGLIRHMANSAATLTFPLSHLDMVRSGIAIYGIHPSPDLADHLELEPALAFKSRVGLVKRIPAGDAISYGQRYTLPEDGNIATIPCGYADGLRRALSDGGEVLIRGRRYRISGTVTMDHFLVDAGDDEIAIGDEVVLIGSQGTERITAQEVADALGTIPYEVVCGISARVPRIYLNRDGA